MTKMDSCHPYVFIGWRERLTKYTGLSGIRGGGERYKSRHDVKRYRKFSDRVTDRNRIEIDIILFITNTIEEYKIVCKKSS